LKRGSNAHIVEDVKQNLSAKTGGSMDSLIEAGKVALVHCQLLGSGQKTEWSNAEMCEILGTALSELGEDVG